MRRADLEHVVAAAAQIVGEQEFVIVGSQAILGSYPDAPPSLLRSQEADVYPRHSPEKAIELEGAIGDGSHFHQTHGYYAHAVGPETAKAPIGWENDWCPSRCRHGSAARRRPSRSALSRTTLVLAKLAANRERDWDFAEDALAARLVDPAVLIARTSALPVPEDLRSAIASSLEAMAARLRDAGPG